MYCTQMHVRWRESQELRLVLITHGSFPGFYDRKEGKLMKENNGGSSKVYF